MFEKKRLHCQYMWWWFTKLLILLAVSSFAKANDLNAESAQHELAQIGEVDADCCTIPSISAIHVNLHEPTDEEIMRARIELSPVGLRVTELGSGASYEMLQNFVTEQAWLIDRKRRIYHQLPLTSDPMGPMPNPGSGASFLSHEACGNLAATIAEPGLWRGRTVDAVSCIDSDGQEQAAELLDHQYKIVVYRRDRLGNIDELQDLQSRKYASGFFFPSADYREVDKREFFMGAPALGVYTPPK